MDVNVVDKAFNHYWCYGCRSRFGIGVVFGALILGVARNPSLKGQLFAYAILGFAFAEATGLFALMMAFCSYMLHNINNYNNYNDY